MRFGFDGGKSRASVMSAEKLSVLLDGGDRAKLFTDVLVLNPWERANAVSMDAKWQTECGKCLIK